MYAADRACVNTLAQALDFCEALGDDVGVAIDTYHVWWDPDLAALISRAGAADRILGLSHLRLAGADEGSACNYHRS